MQSLLLDQCRYFVSVLGFQRRQLGFAQTGVIPFPAGINYRRRSMLLRWHSLIHYRGRLLGHTPIRWWVGRGRCCGLHFVTGGQTQPVFCHRIAHLHKGIGFGGHFRIPQRRRMPRHRTLGFAGQSYRTGPHIRARATGINQMTQRQIPRSISVTLAVKTDHK